MSEYRLYGDQLIEDDNTLRAFVKSLIKSLDIQPDAGCDFEAFKDNCMDLVQSFMADDLSRTDIDHEKLMHRWRYELGDLFYELENHGYELSKCPLHFFGSAAKESLEFCIRMYMDYHFEELAKQKSDWIVTDDDSFQIRRNLFGRDALYELYQVQVTKPLEARDDEKIYGVAHGIQYVSEAEPEEILSCYAYPSFEEFKKEYGDDWRGVIAECDFELKAACGKGIIATDLTWEEAKALICKSSGF